MILAVKCWMENANVTNSLFLILKMSDVACQFKILIKEKMPTQTIKKKKKKKKI
jgi:DNA-directed RNA polymerase subunit RPC12/RpoP